jgi:hypothetical protein
METNTNVQDYNNFAGQAYDVSDWEREANSMTFQSRVGIIRPSSKNGVSVPYGSVKDVKSGIVIRLIPVLQPDGSAKVDWWAVASHVLQLPNSKGEVKYRPINCSGNIEFFKKRKGLVDRANCAVCNFVALRAEKSGEQLKYNTEGVPKIAWFLPCFNVSAYEQQLGDWLAEDTERKPEDWTPPIWLLAANKTIRDELQAHHSDPAFYPINRSPVRIWKETVEGKPAPLNVTYKVGSCYVKNPNGTVSHMPPTPYTEAELRAITWFNSGQQQPDGSYLRVPDISEAIDPSSVDQQNSYLEGAMKMLAEGAAYQAEVVTPAQSRSHAPLPAPALAGAAPSGRSARPQSPADYSF